MAAIGATGVLFGTARFFARGQPATMTKEYQEATNDYLKVCTNHGLSRCLYVASVHVRHIHTEESNADIYLHHRALTSSPSLVSRLRATPAPARSRALPRRNRFATPSSSRERKKCSRISGRASAAFANIERRGSVVRESCFLALAVVKILMEWGKPCILRMLVSICHCTKIFADKRSFPF